MLDEEDDTKAVIAFDGKAITTPGEWNVEIPANTITVDGVAITEAQTFKYTVTEPVYYLVGTMNEWQATEEYLLTKNGEATAEEYMITLDLTADTELKAVKVVGENWTWYPDGSDNNYVVTEDGNYTVYVRPNADGGDDWHCGVIYAQLNKEEEPFNPLELAAISPEQGVCEVLPTEWVLTYGGRKLTVNEDAEVKLTQGETEYQLPKFRSTLV